MGQYERRDFSLGWQPDADAINAPPNCFLRMDNLVLDELGAVALRPGSAKINSEALIQAYSAFNHTSAFETAYIADEGIAQFTAEWELEYFTAGNPDGPGNHNYFWESDLGYIEIEIATAPDVHSLFTANLGGFRWRMTGASSAVFANGANIASGVTGSDDISFGTYQGQIFFARGTTTLKWDGDLVRQWGIEPPANVAVLTALSSDSKVFSTCASAESPAFTGNEGTVGFTADKAGTANAALSLIPDTATARATATKTFAAPTDFTTYDASGIGTDDDLIEFEFFVTEPQLMDRIVLMFDVNDGTFDLDNYSYEFHRDEPIQVELEDEEFLNSDFIVQGLDRDELLSRLDSKTATNLFRQDKPVSNAGWNHFSVPRGKFARTGLTTGKSWATVKAVRVVYVATTGGSSAAVRVDDIRIIGGSTRPLTGRYKAHIVAVRNDGTYQALSGPNAVSAEIFVKAQGIRATIDTSGLDTQVNELWLYLMGGRTDGFYRYGTNTNGPFGGSVTIDATISDRTAMIANLRLETDNARPPDGIVGIEGPHFDRLLIMTPTHLYPSRRLNPDSYAEGEVIQIGNEDEIGYWVRKLKENVYVGTSKDIYRLDGDFTPQPDGTINVRKRPLGIRAAPVGNAVAAGNLNGVEVLIYLSFDGWRVLEGPTLATGQMDLLWRGETRHGVSPVNITDSDSRFRAAITKDGIYAITPEGSDTTESSIIHVYRFDQKRWYRFVYSNDWRSICAEPDGTLIAGADDGFVWTLNEPVNQDAGVDIPIELWTPNDDNGQLFTSKELNSLLLRADTGGATATINFHLDASAASAGSATTARTLTSTESLNVSTLALCRQFQQRITGSFSTFTLRGWMATYLDRPKAQVVHDTGFVELTDTTLAWSRRLNIKARASGTLTVTLYFDGTARAPYTVTVVADKEKVYPVPLGREEKGTTSRAVITSVDPSFIYWVEWEYNVSGKARQRRVELQKEAA